MFPVKKKCKMASEGVISSLLCYYCEDVNAFNSVSKPLGITNHIEFIAYVIMY